MVEGSNQDATTADPAAQAATADALNVGNRPYPKAVHKDDNGSLNRSTQTLSTGHQQTAVSGSSAGPSGNVWNREKQVEQSSTSNSSPQSTEVPPLNGQPPKSQGIETITGGPSAPSNHPVLVRTYNDNMKSARPGAPKGLGSDLDQTGEDFKHNFPPVSSFSFQEILAAIDPEIRGSIDTIAEICGRSKLSLANEYNSHRPPQGELDMPNVDESTEAVQNILHHYLEPVEETASSQGQSSAAAHASATESSYDTPNLSPEASRSASWSLLGVSSPPVGGLNAVTSAPTTQLHQINSHQYSVANPSITHSQVTSKISDTLHTSGQDQPKAVQSDSKPLPNLLGWLQQFQASREASQLRSTPSRKGHSATETLEGILGS